MPDISPRRSALIAAAPLLTAAGLIFVVGPAAADSALCRQVQAQYVAADRMAQAGDYATLRRKLNNARAQMEHGNCRGLGIFRRRGQNCPAIVQTVRQLESQLQNAGGRRLAAQRRDALRGVLVRNGCNVPGSGGASSAQNGVYRTLCARTCDGYYFPLSNSADRSGIKVDEAVCQAMYGGAKAELFVQHPSQPVADASSAIDGSRYGDLAEAFAYRRHYDPACFAELKKGLAAYYAAAEAQQSGHQVSDATPPPQLDSIARDPATVANGAGQSTTTPVEPAGDAGGSVAMRHIGTDYTGGDQPVPNLKALPGPSTRFDNTKSAAAEVRSADRATSVQ